MIVCSPTDNAEVENRARPPNSLPFPSTAPPAVNVTLPAGFPDPDVGATVAVNVTRCPNTDGLCDEVRVVVVDDRV